MPIQVRTIDREFQPKEAADITGVSVALQRDWRRRGLLPEKAESGWAKFELSDIIEMLMMQSFSEAGFSIKAVRECSSMSVLPTLRAILEYPNAVEFEGDQVSSKQKEMFISGQVRGGEGRFLFMAKDERLQEPVVGRYSELSEIDGFLTSRGAVHCTVVDCERMAKTIIEKAGTPVIRMEIEKVESD